MSRITPKNALKYALCRAVKRGTAEHLRDLLDDPLLPHITGMRVIETGTSALEFMVRITPSSGESRYFTVRVKEEK